jgi:RNA polymerase subunit RPABC4/transcription elongation factor Spt4
MQVKNEVSTGFKGEIKIIPEWAWALAAIAFAIPQVLLTGVVGLATAPAALGIRVLVGIVAGGLLGCYCLLIGYVNRDAQRRGMSPLLWTVVAVVVTNGLGIILYFILRQPLQRACPQCGSAVKSGFNFCPQCSGQLSPSCGKCQRVVGAGDVYCPYCGVALGVEGVSAA